MQQEKGKGIAACDEDSSPERNTKENIEGNGTAYDLEHKGDRKWISEI